MFKNCKVVMLPTNQESNYPFLLSNSNVLYKPMAHTNSFKPQALYIIESDSIYNKDLGCWTLYEGKKVELFDDLSMSMDGRYKIIATTDELLKSFKEQTLNGFANLPSPSKSFINKYFVQYNINNFITDILVEYKDTYEEELFIKNDNTITIKKAKDTFTLDEVIRIHKLNCERLNNFFVSSDLDWLEKTIAKEF